MPKYVNRAPIFILGAQRSGTTLLRLLLNSHSRVAIPEEGDFFIPLMRKYRSNLKKEVDGKDLLRFIDYIQNNPQFKLWLLNAEVFFDEIKKRKRVYLADLMSGLYEHYAKTQRKDMWGDKTPSFFRMIPVLSELFPDARFIHIIRDGRDLFLSWRKIDRTKSNISLVALEWIYKIKKARMALNELDSDRSMEIRYEDFVTDLEKKLIKICSFLSLEYEPTMLDYWQKSDRYIGEHHSKLIFRPVSASSINKWKKELSQKELGKFETIAGSVLASNGYELSQGMPRNMLSYINAVFEMSYGLPYRVSQVLLTALNYYTSAKLGFEIYSAEVGKAPANVSNNQLK